VSIRKAGRARRQGIGVAARYLRMNFEAPYDWTLLGGSE
jgi:hypothetical protein